MVGLDNPLHIGLVLVVVLLVFGAKRLPEMGRSVGAGLRGFKDSLQGDVADDDPAVNQLRGPDPRSECGRGDPNRPAARIDRQNELGTPT